MPLGAALGAWLASWIGLADTALFAAVAAPLSALPVVFSAVRGVGAIPDHEPAAERPRPAPSETGRPQPHPPVLDAPEVAATGGVL